MDLNRDQLILSLKRYEDTVGRNVEERYTLPGFGDVLLMNEDDEQEALQYADEIVGGGYLDFCDEVDDYLNDVPAYASAYLKMLPATPSPFLQVGFSNLPMLITKKHLDDMMHEKDPLGEYTSWHGLSVEVIKSLPEALSHPALLADNPGNDHALLAVLDMVDGDGYPLVAPVYPNGRGYLEMTAIITNLILSTFGRDDFRDYFGGAVKPKDIIWADEEGMDDLSKKMGEPLFKGLGRLKSGQALKTPRCISDMDKQQLGIEGYLAAMKGVMGQDALDSVIEPPYPMMAEIREKQASKD